jgi:GNAT superfamily N-acetyltransferase
MTPAVRVAGVGDAPLAGRLLHDFNGEFGVPSPGAGAMARRLAELIEAGAATVLLAGEDGVAVLRLREALWSQGRDAYLEELYVIPARRRRGRGRALLEAAMARAREAGAVRIELGTEDGDHEARALYESAGFTNLADGQQMLIYEREL